MKLKIEKKYGLALMAAISLGSSAVTIASDRDVISIVGSSTVYPFAAVVAERFSKASTFKAPKIESTGTGGGMKLFCAGVGINTPSITNASRAIKSSEREDCMKNGVTAIVEVPIGYDGLTIANAKSAKPMNLSLVDLYKALAKELPNPNGSETLIPNPNKTWKDVNATLPAIKIEVIGPPPTSGTRDTFNELAIESGCAKNSAWIKALKSSDEKRYEKLCRTLREDGAYIEAGENDNLIIQKLQANPNAFGIFGFSFLEENADKVRAVKVNEVLPTFETIANFSYPLSRPLFFYVKKAHVGKVLGIQEYVAEFTGARAAGDEGYLAEKGLIPLPASKAASVAKDAAALKPMTNFQKLP